MESTAALRYWVNRTWFGGNHQILAVICTLLLLQVACLQKPSPYDELVKHGYYVYIVNDDVLSERDWSLITPIKEGQWDLHCQGGPSAPENPLIVAYQDKAGNLQLSIWISGRGSMWDHNPPTKSVHLNTPWSKEGIAEVYIDQPRSPLRYEDIFGNKIVVWGEQTVIEKVNLVNQFEYVGPPMEEVINPWSTEWCAEN